jgi:hypothetical protein
MEVVRFRPLPVWPYPETKNRRSRWTFKVGWQDTLNKLAYEVEWLHGRDILLGAGFDEWDLRKDGLPRADARSPNHPGVELSFTTQYGRLVYATDVCEWWQHNVRSIALGLEALRAVDRYGITRKGEQYAGWLQLETSAPSIDRGRELVREAGGIKSALLRHHPDQGGNPRDFGDVMAFREATGD